MDRLDHVPASQHYRTPSETVLQESIKPKKLHLGKIWRILNKMQKPEVPDNEGAERVSNEDLFNRMLTAADRDEANEAARLLSMRLLDMPDVQRLLQHSGGLMAASSELVGAKVSAIAWIGPVTLSLASNEPHPERTRPSTHPKDDGGDHD